MTGKPSKGKGSKAKLREYFEKNVGQKVNSDTLREVGGTSEWARRVRELRNEEGMNIVTHNDRSELKPGEYLLVDLKPLPAFERGISKEVRAFVLDRKLGSLARCAGLRPARHTPMTQAEKPGSISGILLINQWGERTNPLTFGPFVLCATRGLQI